MAPLNQEDMPDKNFKYVYGPVPSRRLGQSLGINPIPYKTCNYGCVYCQLGRTLHFTNDRQQFFDPLDMWSEIQQALNLHRTNVDFMTFVGEGEPLLCSCIGWLIERIKTHTDLPVAVITNGGLLQEEPMRNELFQADVVMPSLDAGDEKTFRVINRPHPEIHFSAVLEGYQEFRRAFHGQIWVEVMLVKDLNDSEEQLKKIRNALRTFQPDRVYINVPIRPPAEKWVKIPDDEALVRAHAILGNAVSIAHPEEGVFDISGFDSPFDAIQAIIRRHPMREEQIIETLKDIPEAQVRQTLWELERSGKIKRITYEGKRFFVIPESWFKR